MDDIKLERNLLIVDDSYLMLKSLRNMLKGWKRFHLISGAESGAHALSLLQQNHYDLIFMDVNMSPMNGIEATKAILKLKPNQKIVGFSVNQESSVIRNMLKAGARGYISKSSDLEEMQKVITQVLAGEVEVDQEVRHPRIQKLVEDVQEKLVVPLKETPELSEQELQVLTLVNEGHSNEAISRQQNNPMDKVLSTIKTAMQKIGVNNLDDLGNVLKALKQKASKN